MNTSVLLSSIFFMADSVVRGSQGELDEGIVVKLVSPAGALPKIFRLPQCLRPPEGG